ncbi:T9SS type A sorting domain-containing protein, partial [bacterium]|nr:T9SS type A sorting domain-containing protein [bacterium]
SGNLVICVGGVTDNATIGRGDDTYDSAARYGPRGPKPPMWGINFNDLKPEVSAYMRDITSCQGSNPGQSGAGFWQHPGSGTSWAAGHVSGVVALLLDKYRGIPPTQVDNMLRTHAEARGGPTFPGVDPVWNHQYGWGIIAAADAVNAVLLADVSIGKWVPGTWNSKSIWAGHYPVKVGEANTLNARVSANGSVAPGVIVLFEVMLTGWGAQYSPIASTTVSVPSGGTVVATIPYTPLPGMEGHKCYRVTATYVADPNPANNSAKENIDVQEAQKAAARIADGSTAQFAQNAGQPASGRSQRYAFGLTICVDPMAPFPFRTADACICTKDLPPGASAWIEPEPPFDITPGMCVGCSLIVAAPEGVVFGPGNAVYVNGWFWGNGVAEGGMSVYFESAPPIEATISEVQYTNDPTGPSPLVGQVVTVSGIAMTDAGTYPGRFAVQDGEGPWSGLFVTDAGFPVARGDSLTITGTVVETEGLTELDLVTELVTESSGNPLPPSALLEPGVIDTSEAYEGVLVRVEDVVVADDNPDDWLVESTGACRVGRWGGYSYMPVLGNELHVAGVVGALADQHKIQPRDDDDIDYASGVSDDELPTVVSLSQNLPNPFGGDTGITYALPADDDVLLQVFSVDGRLVRTLVDGPRPAGRWNIAWDGKDEDSHLVSSGVYFYRLKTGGKTIEKRMVFMD